MPQSEPKICTAAVVVTFNRLELLKQCVDALRVQTIPCDILIVDNASTDGTAEWAAAQMGISYRNTGSNLGGAGGFNYGMRWAVDAGYDYVWVMDDDTMPKPDALEKLLEADNILKGDYGWLSSVVLWTDGEICRMNLQRRTPYTDIHLTNDDCVPCAMASFVSLFLKAETIKKYGLPIKDFFIWSDDWEYTRRISMNQLCYVASNSIVVHAMKSNKIVNISDDSADRITRYKYFYRNDVYLYRREGFLGWLWLIAKNTKHSLQAVIKRRPISTIGVIWKGFFDGIVFNPDVDTFNE